MTVKEVKQRLVDKIGKELLKDDIFSGSFKDFAETIYVLMLCDLFEKETDLVCEPKSHRKPDIDELFKSLFNDEKKN